MKNILLVCNAGMSTSMLVTKMQNAAKDLGADVHIEAKPLSDAKKAIEGVDIVFLGPQIRYELDNIKKIAGNIPVEAINMQDYGLMNGKKVLARALELIGE